VVSLHVAVTLAFALLPGGEQVDMGHSSASLSFAVTGGEQVYRADTTFTWGRPILHQTGRILRLHGVVQFCIKLGGYYVYMGSSNFASNRADTAFTWGRPILLQTGWILRAHGVVEFRGSLASVVSLRFAVTGGGEPT